MTKSTFKKIQQAGDKIDINKAAKLASLSLTPQESKIFEKQLSAVLSYVNKLSEVETKSVEPIGHITGLVNVTREDIASPSLSQEDALRNAPKTHNGLFMVNAIFEEN